MKYSLTIFITLLSMGFSEKRIPAEWETQEAVWMQWPMQFEHWYRNEFGEVIAALQEYQTVHVLVQDNSQQNQAQNFINNNGGNGNNVTYHIQSHENAWLRDNGPMYVEDNNQLVIQDMIFDGWGGAVTDFDDDDQVPCIMADWLDLPCENLDFIMERGNMEFNGVGDMLINWDCWNDRNPQYSESQSDAILIEAFSVTNVVWTHGHSPYDITKGHIDGVARFINETTVAVSQYVDANDEEAWIADDAATAIETAGFEVVRIDMPGYINYWGYEIPAIYMNWLQINNAIIGNAYGVASWDNIAQQQIENLFPGYEVILIETPEVNIGGGGIHCITNDQPLFNPTTTVVGDVNEDGLVNVIDVVQVVQLILSGEFNAIADMNNDGGLNVIDIVQLVNIILGE